MGNEELIPDAPIDPAPESISEVPDQTPEPAPEQKRKKIAPKTEAPKVEATITTKVPPSAEPLITARVLKNIPHVYIGGKYYDAKKGDTVRWPLEVVQTFREDNAVL